MSVRDWNSVPHEPKSKQNIINDDTKGGRFTQQQRVQDGAKEKKDKSRAAIALGNGLFLFFFVEFASLEVCTDRKNKTTRRR